MIEVLVVLGIMGIFLVVSYPNIMNTLAVRNLENATREIQTFLQQTKIQAVNTRIAHRVRFYHQGGGAAWAYQMESLQEDGTTWASAHQGPAKTISLRFNVTIALPIDTTTGDPVAVFSSLGMFPQYAVGQNTIALQSPKLLRQGQDDERVLSMYMGGSIQYVKRKSV